MIIEARRHIALVISVCLVSISSFSQFYNTQVEAKINLENNSEFIEITGSAFNKTELSQSLRFVLSVIKNNPQNSNRSKNDQSGRLVLNPGQKKNLSKTTINANDKDRIIILLLIYNTDDTLLGKDRIIINGTAADLKAANNKRKNENSTIPDVTKEKGDGVILRGIVIEDTKTKPGRDFYKMFYSLYTSNNINGEKIVTIKEKLAIANNTKLEIIVDNEKILEFFVRPQNDYLRTMSVEAIKRVYLYFQRLKTENNIVKRY